MWTCGTTSGRSRPDAPGCPTTHSHGLPGDMTIRLTTRRGTSRAVLDAREHTMASRPINFDEKDQAAQERLESAPPTRAIRVWTAREALDRLRRDVAEGRVTGMSPVEGTEVPGEQIEATPADRKRRPRDRWSRPAGG